MGLYAEHPILSIGLISLAVAAFAYQIWSLIRRRREDEERRRKEVQVQRDNLICESNAQVAHLIEVARTYYAVSRKELHGNPGLALWDFTETYRSHRKTQQELIDIADPVEMEKRVRWLGSDQRGVLDKTITRLEATIPLDGDKLKTKLEALRSYGEQLKSLDEQRPLFQGHLQLLREHFPETIWGPCKSAYDTTAVRLVALQRTQAELLQRIERRQIFAQEATTCASDLRKDIWCLQEDMERPREALARSMGLQRDMPAFITRIHTMQSQADLCPLLPNHRGERKMHELLHGQLKVHLNELLESVKAPSPKDWDALRKEADRLDAELAFVKLMSEELS